VYGGNVRGVEHLAERLAEIPGVVTVSLGGSRAQGAEQSGSDWDFCLYYRGGLRAEDIRALDFPGQVFEPGDWGRLLNGGAWLHVDDRQVDLLYRDLDFVEHSIAEAEQGRFEIDEAQGYVAGLPSYFLVGEVALAKVLSGGLPGATFYDVLRRTASERWYEVADFSLREAEFAASRCETVTCAGLLAKAAIAAAHGRLAERGEWVFNEKRILQRAAITDADALLAAGIGTHPAAVHNTVLRMKEVLALRASAS